MLLKVVRFFSSLCQNVFVIKMSIRKS